MVNNIITALPPAVAGDEDHFRAQRLYCEEMDILYDAHLKTLKALYSRYRLPVVGQKRPRQLALKVGGFLRIITRPTLNLLLCLRASV